MYLVIGLAHERQRLGLGFEKRAAPQLRPLCSQARLTAYCLEQHGQHLGRGRGRGRGTGTGTGIGVGVGVGVGVGIGLATSSTVSTWLGFGLWLGLGLTLTLALAPNPGPRTACTSGSCRAAAVWSGDSPG